ncbi:MAG: hypothetical protein HDS72_01535 [Bacteroidales bacterium]|nr:hypothetical protein [Bacteroidales bacterium]
MKRKVKFSGWAMGLTVMWIVLLIAMLGISIRRAEGYVVITALLLMWFVAGLVYMPLAVSVDGHFLAVHRPLWAKRISLADIESVELMPPTMGAQRLLGSAGVMGYWGRYEERDLGKYFAYYWRSSDCFLVRLRNGHQYMLGCENPADMVEAIKAKIA